MATYTILTTRKQQIGLQYSYDHYADKAAYPTIDAYLQSRVSATITNPMYEQEQAAQAVSFDSSFNTIPETSQPKARTDIELAITSNGGTIVPPGPVGLPPPIQPTAAASTSVFGGPLSFTGREDSSNLQTGTADKATNDTGRRDGEGDNPS